MSTAVPSSTSPPIAFNDFADWLSPILVKELRQGLKTKMFVSVFILLQAVMIILVGLQLLSMTNRMGRSETEMFNVFFWGVIWIPLLIVMPARGFVAVASEVKANTLDLVQLTRLTAFRIVLGKWVALVAQTLLLVAAVLPYTVLRYFFGGVDVIADLTMLAGVLQGSLLLTAFTVMLSSTHLVVRVLVVVAGFPLMMMGLSALSAAWLFGGAMGGTFPGAGGDELLTLVLGLISTAATIYFLLEMAAGRIAPLAENHSGRRRAVALAVAFTLPWIIWLNQGRPEVVLLANGFLPICVWAILEALCERTVSIPSLYRPFAKRGWLGRLAGRIFYPGWATGLVFVFLMLASFVGVASWESYRQNPTVMVDEVDTVGLTMILAFTALVAPVYVLRMFPRMKQPFWLYLLVQALCVLLFVVGSIIADWPGSDSEERAMAMRWLAPVPLGALCSLFSSGHSNPELPMFYWKVSVPICGLLITGLGILAFQEFRLIRRLEKESIGE